MKREPKTSTGMTQTELLKLWRDAMLDNAGPLVMNRVIEPEGCWCTDCKQECRLVEETFDYAGTHCTHGKPGTHHTGNYVSDCCGAEYTYENPLTCPECGSNHTIQCHHEGNGVAPECDYLECEDCNHQWGHE